MVDYRQERVESQDTTYEEVEFDPTCHECGSDIEGVHSRDCPVRDL